MSELRIYPEDRTRSPEVLINYADIAHCLNGIGVLFERWSVSRELDPDATQDEIIEAYREDIDRLMQQHGFQALDVISMYPEHPRKEELRERFRREHTHAEFEMRFFVEGDALFYLRKNGQVYAMRCAGGDLVSVPANTAHWFDMGRQPRFRAIRLFSGAGNSEARYTGSPIADQYPRLDEAALARDEG